MSSRKTWVVIGASRGIGHEFVQQLLARGERVIATVRAPSLAQTRSEWSTHLESGACRVFECDMLSERSINAFAIDLEKEKLGSLDHVVLNAGVLQYPSRSSEMSYDDFAHHLHTNTIGPIICAQRLTKAFNGLIGTVTFISSDSGSAQAFLEHEDGFAAYAASKAALNQALRHMAAEQKRKGSKIIIVALHPGEVATDMAVDLPWDVNGQMTPSQSVAACIPVIESKGEDDTGTFWTWENKPYPW